jgi:U3 small nucleolar RNA-associated protein MPP10
MLKDLEDKPWQKMGEVTAKSRPKDSLLEEYVDFDAVTRLAPIQDADSTEKLEKLIKQRIKDKAFDDVERKVKPIDMQYEYKKQVVLDQEKSKLGLGEVYEQEYLKQQENQLDAANGVSAEDKPKNPKHEEIRKRLQDLFIKLDALSNFHFTPKAVSLA